MAHPKTQAFRPVCRAVNQALQGGLPSGPFNFGLYFMKWFFVADGLPPREAPRPKKPWACCLSDETKLKQKGNRHFDPNIRLDNLEVSLALFNGDRQYIREVLQDHRGKIRPKPGPMPLPSSWDRAAMQKLLHQKHHYLEAAARSFVRLGYQYHRLERHLTSPLILGLGLEHPSEKGFRFDWTLGLPVIPASGLKGVVRLAWLVQELNRQPDAEAARLFARQVTKDNHFPEPFRLLFGTGGEKDARRGRVVFLDAYPGTLPRLKAEIMNCHYPDYLNKKRRGPTEDQRPNPQKFWAVHPLAEDRRPLAFVFRLLLSPEIAGDHQLREGLLQAFEAALQEHGLGAKTAIGHGRFRAEEIPPEVPGREAQVQKEEDKSPKRAPSPETQIWESARLTWNPGRQEVEATWQGKRATGRGRDLVPEELQQRLKNKKKAVAARVTVEPVGLAFRVVKIETGD